MADPRVFFLSGSRHPSSEVSLEWVRQRGWDVPGLEQAVEIAPGVRISLMGTGDSVLPDGTTRWGARVAVWAGHETPGTASANVGGVRR